MSRHDILLRSQFERIIEGDRVGQALISFYEKLPEENYRRALYILSIIYPIKLNVGDDEFKFIFYIMSQKKFLRQQTISDFVRSINVIEFTETWFTMQSCEIHKNKMIEHYVIATSNDVIDVLSTVSPQIVYD